MSEYFHHRQYDGDYQPFDTLDDAVEDYLNDFVDPTGWPETVTIFGYSVKRIPVQDPRWVDDWANHIAESLWERLDEDFGNSDESQGAPTEVIKLAQEFILDAANHYNDHNIWPDDTSETVNVREWVLANHPDWLTEATPTIPDVTPDKEAP